MTEPQFHRPPTRGTTRVVPLVLAGVVSVFALALAVAGGVLLWADGEKNADGYLSTAEHSFQATGHAIATDDLDVDLDGAGRLLDRDILGKVRVTAESRTGKPVFVGIARTRDVDAYLGGTAHATVTDLDYDPFSATYAQHSGARRPAAPAAQDFWAVSAQGSGARTATWKVRDGNWSVVVMNADGSRGVDAGVVVGANAPFLAPIGWGVLGGALLLFAGAGALTYGGIRGGRRSTEPAPREPVAV